MKRRTMLAALGAALAVCGSVAGFVPVAQADENGSFRIGVAPHTSARFIIEQYQPIRQALETALGQPVEIQTAPDFSEFARRGLEQEYDLAITTGHQARLLEKDAGYQALLTYRADFKAVAVVSLDSPVKGPRDLDGTTIIGLSPTSLVTLWGQHWLKNSAVTGTQIRYVSAADSVGQLLLAGEGAAGFMSTANFQGLAPDVRAKLRFLTESPAMVGRVYLLNSRQKARAALVRTTLEKFAASDAGMRYFETYKLGGYRAVEAGELQAMDPYADETRRLLKETAK